MNDGIERTEPADFGQKARTADVTSELGARLGNNKVLINGKDIIALLHKQVTDMTTNKTTSTCNKYH